MSYNLQGGGGGGNAWTLDPDPCNLASFTAPDQLMVDHAADHFGSTTYREMSNQLWDVANNPQQDIPDRSVQITNPSNCYDAFVKVWVYHGDLWIRETGQAITNEYTMRYYPEYASAISGTPPVAAIYPNYTLIHTPSKNQTLEPWSSESLGSTGESIILPAGQTLSVSVAGRLLQRLPTTGPTSLSFYIWHETVAVDLWI